MSHCPGCSGMYQSAAGLAECKGCGHEAELAQLKAHRQTLLESCLQLTYARDAMEKERDALRADLKAVAEALQEAKAQWGDDYLWQKWMLDDAIARPGVQSALDRAVDAGQDG